MQYGIRRTLKNYVVIVGLGLLLYFMSSKSKYEDYPLNIQYIFVTAQTLLNYGSQILINLFINIHAVHCKCVLSAIP